MIQVEISINGKSIDTQVAHRITGENRKMCEYKTSNGHIIKHHHSHGARKLAIKMLEKAIETRSPLQLEKDIIERLKKDGNI